MSRPRMEMTNDAFTEQQVSMEYLRSLTEICPVEWTSKAPCQTSRWMKMQVNNQIKNC